MVLDRNEIGALGEKLREVALSQETDLPLLSATAIDQLQTALGGRGLPQRDVVARAGYRAGAAIRVTCVYDRRSAPIYLEGKLSQRADGLTFSPTDRTAPGRLGANSGLYDAVGDGTLTPDVPPPKAQRCQSDAGTLGDIRTYNRALTAAEVARLAAALL
jgi:hypothetical protein